MRSKKGIVTSAKMTDTVTVTVHRHAFHPIYKKRFRKSKKFLADSTGVEDLQEGDTVIITECRPLSKRKCFKISEVVERVPRVSEIQEEEGIEEAIHGKKEGIEGIEGKEGIEGVEEKQDESFLDSSDTDSPSEKSDS